MPKSTQPLIIPASRPKRRIGVLPTRTERSKKDRESERPKHKHRQDEGTAAFLY